GVAESMFERRTVQDYPPYYDNGNEQDRYRETGRIWPQTAEPGSRKWEEVIREMVALDFTVDPTLSIYEANRDLMAARTAEWHRDYTLPYYMKRFETNPDEHASVYFDWKTSDEIAWKSTFLSVMRFINDYKNAGGRVTTGADEAYSYK